MKQVICFYLFFIVFFSMVSLESNAIDISFVTITDALNYDGNKEEVTKLIITGTIAGDDYSIGSEWREFSSLDKTFPQIEAIEIWTYQDIPDIDGYINSNGYFVPTFGLFYSYGSNHAGWLKSFSAPNTKHIGSYAFRLSPNLTNVFFPQAETIGDWAFAICSKLSEIDFPSAITVGDFAFYGCHFAQKINLPLARTIGNYAFQNIRFNLSSVTLPSAISIGDGCFRQCLSLTSIDLPKVSYIGDYAFLHCSLLTNVSIGTALTEVTPVLLEAGSFLNNNMWFLSDDLTPNIDLVLGSNVFPKPHIEYNAWHYANVGGHWVQTAPYPYRWKSITIYTTSVSETITSNFMLFPNPATTFAYVTFSLEKRSEITLDVCDINGRVVWSVSNFLDEGEHRVALDLHNLSSGNYFCRLLINNQHIDILSFSIIK